MDGYNDSNNEGIWIGDRDGLRLVVRAGQRPPEFPATARFASFEEQPVMNNRDDIAFVATVAGPDFDSGNDRGIFSGSDDNLELVAFAGFSAFGLEDGVKFGRVFGQPVINSLGRTAFRAQIVGPGVNLNHDLSVWSEGLGGIHLVARGGQNAPGTGEGVIFGGDAKFQRRFTDPAINSAGQTAFLATLSGPGVNESNREGIWAEDRNRGLQLIAREGDKIEVAPGDSRTISNLCCFDGVGNEDGRGITINDFGQVRFLAEFTDRSTGVFVSNLVADLSEAILQPGDANQDLSFDQRDITHVLSPRSKYRTEEPASWGEGDWNGAPGGYVGEPPAGDGKFDQLDIIAALSSGVYLTGEYAAELLQGIEENATTQVIYDRGTGALAIDGTLTWTSISIHSRHQMFVGEEAASLTGIFDVDSDGEIFKATFGTSFGPLSFGRVARAELSEDFIRTDLIVDGTFAGGGRINNVELVYVPEPTSLVLLLICLPALSRVALCRAAPASSRLVASYSNCFAHLSWGILVSIFAIETAISAPTDVRTVALSHTQAPGTSSDFHEFVGAASRPPSINSAGQVSFRARLLRSSPQTDEGIWAEQGNTLALIARESDLAVMETIAEKFHEVPRLTIPQIIDDGRVVFIERSTSGILMGGPSPLELIVGTTNGSPLPLPNPFVDQEMEFGGATNFAINPPGHIAFHGEVSHRLENGHDERKSAIWARDRTFNCLCSKGTRRQDFLRPFSLAFFHNP